MAIKQPRILTRQEFDQAMVHLRLNISEVSRETGIPRTYLSEFRNGDRQLRPENLAKLKDLFENRGLEFEDDRESAAQTEQLPATTTPEPQQSAAAPYRFWPVFLDVDQAAAIKVMGIVQDNDARLAVLLQQTTKSESGFFGNGEFASATKDALQEAFGLMAANYALFRSLSGWPALGLTPSAEDPQTLRDVIFTTFQQQFAEAGLIIEGEVLEGAE